MYSEKGVVDHARVGMECDLRTGASLAELCSGSRIESRHRFVAPRPLLNPSISGRCCYRLLVISEAGISWEHDYCSTATSGWVCASRP